jgi:hypothetical protein
MHLRNKPPVFVPTAHRAEIEKLSKAALMDMVWDYAVQFAGGDGKEAIDEFRARRDLILSYRNQGAAELAD